MQKYIKNNETKKASILIWAIFLSIIISVTFAMISAKITKNLNNNSNIINNLENFNNWYLLNKKNSILKNWDNLIFEEDNNINRTIKNNEIYNINTIITEDSYLDIFIINWSELYYKVISYSWSLWLSSSWITSKWLIQNNYRINFNYDTDKDHKIIQLQNLWWYSNITLSWSIILNTNYKKFSTINKIWNKFFIKSSGLLNN